VRHVHSYGTGWEDKRAELPVEQPTKVELVFKSRTAKALRLTIPHSLLVRAERVIE
jgi:putative ABC transport system substrate-binding protein